MSALRYNYTTTTLRRGSAQPDGKEDKMYYYCCRCDEAPSISPRVDTEENKTKAESVTAAQGPLSEPGFHLADGDWWY